MMMIMIVMMIMMFLSPIDRYTVRLSWKFDHPNRLDATKTMVPSVSPESFKTNRFWRKTDFVFRTIIFRKHVFEFWFSILDSRFSIFRFFDIYIYIYTYIYIYIYICKCILYTYIYKYSCGSCPLPTSLSATRCPNVFKIDV